MPLHRRQGARVMAAVDLNGDLIPRTAAAGWRIGTRLTQCSELVRGAAEVEYRPGFNLRDAINRNVSVLVVRNYFPVGSGNTAVIFGAHVVRFDFNAASELFCIWAFEGYRGRAFSRIGIGSPLEELRSLFPVVYDDGDEMYYPDQEISPEAPRGIAFIASQEDPPGDPSIIGICVHDWDIMRRSTL